MQGYVIKRTVLLCAGFLNKLQSPAFQLLEPISLTVNVINTLQKLIEGTEVNIDTFIATDKGISREEAQQLFARRGFSNVTSKESKLLTV